MNEIEMSKEIAKLEGVKVFMRHGVLSNTPIKSLFGAYYEYNPITDMALNCELRDKYEVDIYHGGRSVSIDHGNKLSGADVTYESKEDIPSAVIECILKSEGLYEQKRPI